MLAEAKTRKEIRDALWNPANGRHSSELEIVSSDELRRRRIEIAIRNDAQRQEREATERRAAIVFDLLYEKAHREHIQRERGYWSVETIAKFVCIHFAITRIDLMSERRTANVVRPRHVAMYLAKTLTLRSLPEIGRRLGGRDHTTVLFGVRKIQRLLDSGHPKVTSDIASLRAALGAE